MNKKALLCIILCVIVIAIGVFVVKHKTLDKNAETSAKPTEQNSENVATSNEDGSATNVKISDFVGDWYFEGDSGQSIRISETEWKCYNIDGNLYDDGTIKLKDNKYIELYNAENALVGTANINGDNLYFSFEPEKEMAKAFGESVTASQGGRGDLIEEEADNNTSSTNNNVNDNTSSNSETENYVIGAFEKYLKEDEGILEYKIESVKLVDREELIKTAGTDALEFEDSIPAEIKYSIRPVAEKFMEYTAGDGEENGEWITNKSACVEVVNTTKGFSVTKIGTGW